MPFWKGELFFSFITMFRNKTTPPTKVAQGGLSDGQANSSPRGAISAPFFLSVGQHSKKESAHWDVDVMAQMYAC